MSNERTVVVWINLTALGLKCGYFFLTNEELGAQPPILWPDEACGGPAPRLGTLAAFLTLSGGPFTVW